MRTLGGEGPLSQKSKIFASSPRGRAKGGKAACQFVLGAVEGKPSPNGRRWHGASRDG